MFNSIRMNKFIVNKNEKKKKNPSLTPGTELGVSHTHTHTDIYIYIYIYIYIVIFLKIYLL